MPTSEPDETPADHVPEPTGPVDEEGHAPGPMPPADRGFYQPAPAPGYGYPGPHPFLPTYREPWINPRKKRAAGLAGLAAAVVLLGAGFALGAATGGGHGDRTGYGRVGNERGAGDGLRNGPQFGPGRPGGQRIHPGRPGLLQPTDVPSATTSAPAASSATPAPTSSSR